jgi:photosystem II stability/assembly factor-like uncharacterized protein
MATHPHDPETVYIVPIESDQYRCTPEGKLRVYRTTNAGETWEPLTRGLPQKNANETILRDALATDTCDPAGIYFGTRSGKVYGSSDDGKSWKVIMEGLPAVVCVKAAWVGGDRKNLTRRHGDTENRKATKSRVARSRAAKSKAVKSVGRRSRAVGKAKPAKHKTGGRSRAAR